MYCTIKMNSGALYPSPKIFGYCILFLTMLMLSGIHQKTYAQTEVDERAVLNFEEGLGFLDPDSLFGINIRFRMQSRLAMNTLSQMDFSPNTFEANVRRARLRFDGFMGTKDFSYYIQLSFSRGDQDWDVSGFPGILRDAMVFYHFTPSFYIGFGQGKLPGNRQRVISSGSLQFTDRSRLNAEFNVDRDFGLMAYYTNEMTGIPIHFKGAISSGEGRNITRTDKGLAYTGRIEILPLGNFTRSGDFFEGDLFREPDLKVSIAGGFSYNHKAIRTLGQRGYYFPEPQNIQSLFFDMITKYNGISWSSEFARRKVNDHKTMLDADGILRYVFTGLGFNTQVSYLLPSDFEMALRYTFIEPDENLLNINEKEEHIYTLGFTKHLREHKNKLQLNISYFDYLIMNDLPENGWGNWQIMFQVETGI